MELGAARSRECPWGRLIDIPAEANAIVFAILSGDRAAYHRFSGWMMEFLAEVDRDWYRIQAELSNHPPWHRGHRN
jgi:hypothetical protein